MAPRRGASMMLLVGKIGPKLFLPICIILSKTVSLSLTFLTRVRGHDEISRLDFRAEETCASGGAPILAMLAIFSAVLASFRVTSRPCRDHLGRLMGKGTQRQNFQLLSFHGFLWKI